MDAFAKQLLESHNRYRELHQSPPLAYDQGLADSAQKWADCIAARDKLETDVSCRCRGSMVGENVAMKFCTGRTDFPGSDFADYWYSSVVDYDFSGKSEVQSGSPALSFIQLVWKGSANVGFGRAVSPTGQVFVVARYSPGGNCLGDLAANVLPTRDGKLPEFVTSGGGGGDKPCHHGDASSGVAYAPVKSNLTPVIGGKSPEDVLIDASTNTRIEGAKKIVTLEEKYRCPDGSTYTREKQRVYMGALRK